MQFYGQDDADLYKLEVQFCFITLANKMNSSTNIHAMYLAHIGESGMLQFFITPHEPFQ